MQLHLRTLVDDIDFLMLKGISSCDEAMEAVGELEPPLESRRDAACMGTDTCTLLSARY